MNSHKWFIEVVQDFDGTYYIFGTHVSGGSTTDLKNWRSMEATFRSTLYSQEVKDQIRAWNKDSSVGNWFDYLWAPDIIYNEAQGLYYLYYCTTSTWNASNLCYGVSENVDGPFEWKGALIYSGFNKDTIKATSRKKVT